MFSPLLLRYLLWALIPFCCLAAIQYQEVVDQYRQERLLATRDVLMEAENLVMAYIFGGLNNIEKLSDYVTELNDQNKEDPLNKGNLSDEEFRKKLIARYIEEPCEYFIETFKDSLKATLSEPEFEQMANPEDDEDFLNGRIIYQVCESILTVVIGKGHSVSGSDE